MVDKKNVIEKVKQNRSDFMDFLNKYNVVELAIGVVIGAAVKDLVNSIANDMIMPIVGIISPGGSWRSLVFSIAGSEFKVGNLLGATLNFLIIAGIVFVVIKKILKVDKVDSKKKVI